jgi:hypothetical protein
MATIRLMTELATGATYLEVDGKKLPSYSPLYASYLIEYNRALIDRFNKYIGLLESDNNNLRTNADFALNYLAEMDKKNLGGNLNE